jgi:hypothetical protein
VRERKKAYGKMVAMLFYVARILTYALSEQYGTDFDETWHGN